MKITHITTYRLPPRWMFLKIETDDGVVGWGEPVIEGRARTVEAAVHEFADYLIGKDPARINDLWQVMYRAGFYRGGPIMMSAIAGIDQALWDIKGKVLNAPVWQLMGGLVRDKIKAYSWVGGDRPADVIDGIEKLRGIGFDTFKLNGCEEMGVIDNSRAVDAAINTVAQIREAFGSEIEFGLDFHGRVSAPMAELEYIRDGGGLVDGDAPAKKEARQPLTKADWKLVFHRKLVGVYLGQFAVNSTLWFFLTWFPNYLTQEKGITALKAGFMTTVPFLAAFFGVLLSGWLADKLVKKGFSLGVARKTPIICGLLISTCIMGANYTNDPLWIMALMAIAFFGNGFASITWSLISSLAPMRLIGLTGGMFNFIGGLGGISVPLVIGYLAQSYGFAPALVYISVVALLGALSYILLVGDVKRVG